MDNYFKKELDRRMTEDWSHNELTDKRWVEKWKKEITGLDALRARADFLLNKTRYWDPILLSYIRKYLKEFTKKLSGFIKAQEEAQREWVRPEERQGQEGDKGRT